MQTGSELAAWLEDGKRRLVARDRAQAFARRWAERTLFVELEEQLALKGALADVLAAAGRFMDRSPDLAELIAELVAEAKADSFFVPPLTVVATELSAGYLLFAHPSLTITLGVISPDGLAAKKLDVSGPRAINFTGLLTSYRFLKSGGATMSLWEAPAVTSDFSGDAARSCRFARRQRIADGEALIVDGRRESIVIEHLESEMLCLQASVQVEAAPLSIEYDSRSLRYLGASSTDEASSRTQMMVTLLRLMDRADALPVIEQALASPHFYTRWHVMREMLALDAEAALPRLRMMAASDPHPEVRFAATQAIDLFFPDAAEELQQCRA